MAKHLFQYASDLFLQEVKLGHKFNHNYFIILNFIKNLT